jgi:hypothetical protein
MTSPRMKQNLRPQMSVSLLPGIIRAIGRVKSVRVVWDPRHICVHVVGDRADPTFMFDAA